MKRNAVPVGGRSPRALGLLLLLAFSSCGTVPVTLVGFSNERLQMELTEGEPDYQHSAETGMDSLDVVSESSLCSLRVAPVTSFNLPFGRLERSDTKGLIRDFKGLFPELSPITAEPLPGPGCRFEIRSPKLPNDWVGHGRIWAMKEAHTIAFLFVAGHWDTPLEETSERIQQSLRVLAEPLLPPDRKASALRADIPADWKLTESAEKRHWSSPDGQAFFSIFKGAPNPSAERVPGYGANAVMARTAIEFAEMFSGRDTNVRDSGVFFCERRFVRISRATGTVSDGKGSYTVEMDMWYDPRLGTTAQVYLGGRTEAALKSARQIRETLSFKE